jgi:hypothetical protein
MPEAELNGDRGKANDKKRKNQTETEKGESG